MTSWAITRLQHFVIQMFPLFKCSLFRSPLYCVKLIIIKPLKIIFAYKIDLRLKNLIWLFNSDQTFSSSSSRCMLVLWDYCLVKLMFTWLAVKRGQLSFMLFVFWTIAISCLLRLKEIIHLASIECVSFIELPAALSSNTFYIPQAL